MGAATAGVAAAAALAPVVIVGVIVIATLAPAPAPFAPAAPYSGAVAHTKAHPLPKTPPADLASAARRPSSPAKSASTARLSAALADVAYFVWVEPCGARVFQKRAWFHAPPPWFRTAVLRSAAADREGEPTSERATGSGVAAATAEPLAAPATAALYLDT